MLPSTLLTASPLRAYVFRGSIAHPTRSLCTLRGRRRRRPRNTRYRAPLRLPGPVSHRQDHASLPGAQAIHCHLAYERWIASRSLSSGAHSRDPLARNDSPLTQNNSQQIAPASEWRLRLQRLALMFGRRLLNRAHESPSHNANPASRSFRSSPARHGGGQISWSASRSQSRTDFQALHSSVDVGRDRHHLAGGAGFRPPADTNIIMATATESLSRLAFIAMLYGWRAAFWSNPIAACTRCATATDLRDPLLFC